MYTRFGFTAALVFLVLTLGCGSKATNGNDSTVTRQVRVVQVFPHDQGAFCQGLVVDDAVLFEGTGQYGKSSLRKVDLETGRVQLIQSLPKQYFGEGITILGERIYQLTWKSRTCVVYDKSTMRAIGRLSYAGEGWGLANDGKHIFMSDGTNTIRVLDPNTFEVLRRIRVKSGRRNVTRLNELEFVNGKILANMWYSDQIAEVDPESGLVTAWIDCSGVYPARSRPSREHVLNGIAYDAKSDRLFITGKNWPNLFEIKIVGPEAN